VTRTAVVSLGAAAVVGAVLVTNTSPPKPVATNTHTVPPKPMALTGVVGEGSVSKLVSSKGVLAAAQTINLGFPIGHKLRSINVKVGDKVKKGQLLVVEGHVGQKETTLQTWSNSPVSGRR
jgi:multidrug efflux pump subunit AcrA (membrane-fusion protein)